MPNRIAHDRHTDSQTDALGEADLRAALGPAAVDATLMVAVDEYIPTPDATENLPPNSA